MTIEFDSHTQNYKELFEYHRTNVTLRQDNCCCHCDLWETKGFSSRGDRSERQCAGRIASHNLITTACSQMM